MSNKGVDRKRGLTTPPVAPSQKRYVPPDLGTRMSKSILPSFEGAGRSSCGSSSSLIDFSSIEQFAPPPFSQSGVSTPEALASCGLEMADLYHFHQQQRLRERFCRVAPPPGSVQFIVIDGDGDDSSFLQQFSSLSVPEVLSVVSASQPVKRRKASELGERYRQAGGNMDAVPDEYICPVSFDIMSQPVWMEDGSVLKGGKPGGHHYDLDTVLTQARYQSQSSKPRSLLTSPLTRLPFTKFEVNLNMQRDIEKFVEAQELKASKPRRLKAY